MKRSVIAALTVGLTGLGSVLLASPSGAQEQLEMSLSPEVAAPGEEITAAAVDPCEGDGTRFMNWAIGPVGEDVVPDNDGSHLGANWVVTFEAPEAEGDYQFVASCQIGETPDPQSFIYSAEFTVESDGPEPPGDDPAPADPAPADPAPADPAPADPAQPAPPAQPVEGTPTFTG
jgi:hypothetical protein